MLRLIVLLGLLGILGAGALGHSTAPASSGQVKAMDGGIIPPPPKP